jgi:hypothetical protein
MFGSVPLIMMMASKMQAGTHFPHPLQRENSTYTGSLVQSWPERVLHAARFTGSQPWQISQLTSGLNKISSS